MAIKALKQNVSIREIQKMIHQWKAWGVSDSACLKLLDLYLGMPHFMNEDGVYPINNLYQICLALKTIHTSSPYLSVIHWYYLFFFNLAAVCGSFG